MLTIIRTIMILFAVVFFNSFCLAETIHLKNGKKIEGEIIQKTDQFIKINVRGITLTYYSDEIEQVEGYTEETPSVYETKGHELLSPTQLRPQVPREQPVEAQVLSHTPLHRTSSVQNVTKKELIIQMITASGAREQMGQTFAAIISQASPEEAQQLKSVFNIDEIVSELVPIYEKYYTKEELQDLVAFYQSAAGQKLLKVTPLIMQESGQVSVIHLQKKMQELTEH